MNVLINPYLNAAPLWWTLRENPPPGWRIEAVVPSAAVDALAAGAAELALVSAVALVQLPGIRALHDWGVAARGAVDTVVLIHKRPLASLRTIGIDAASRSAAGLLRVLCARHFHIQPQYMPVADPGAALAEVDAVLAIGDKTFDLGPGLPRLDLAKAWTDWTELPFLFAAWGAGPGAATPENSVLLGTAAAAGLARRPEIAAHFALDLRLPAATLEEYLHTRVYHRLQEADWRGLARYAEEARMAGLLADFRLPDFF